jgi:predicted Zn-dependent protease
VTVLNEAIRAFNGRDYDSALAKISEADRMFPDTLYALNMRGAIAIEQRKMDDGEKYCLEALKRDPRFFPARFNLAEIPFVQKHYAAARKRFEDLLSEEPKNELLQYRIFLTHLLERNDTEARKALDALPFPSNTAAYYYAHAAWEFAHGNEAAAKGWIRSGEWVFPLAKNSNFADVLYDLGWLKRPENTAP